MTITIGEQIYQLLRETGKAANSLSAKLEYAHKALAVARENLEPHNQLTAEVLKCLGELQFREQLSNPKVETRDWSKCQASFDEALAIDKATLGVDHEEVLQLHIALGQMFLEKSLGQDKALLEVALAQFQEALSSAQRTVAGNDLNLVLRLTACVASVLQQLGRYKDAYYLTRATKNIAYVVEGNRAAAAAIRYGTPPVPQLKRVP